MKFHYIIYQIFVSDIVIPPIYKRLNAFTNYHTEKNQSYISLSFQIDRSCTSIGNGCFLEDPLCER